MTPESLSAMHAETHGEGDTKRFDPAALATLTTGIMMVHDFGEVHEAAEWLLGHPVWTHEFVHPPTKVALIAAVVEQFPDVPTEKPADWQACRRALHERYGDTVEVRRGNHDRAAGPVETLGEVRS